MNFHRYLLILALVFFQSCGTNTSPDWKWEVLQTSGTPTARHEAGFVAYKKNLFLIGGRGIKPTSVFDTEHNTWKDKAAPPIEIHHFQPVVFGDAIYIVGAMTGPWPNEKPLEKVLVYYPEKDEFVFSHSIPKHRRRGGAGVVVYKDKIYIVGGITNGHMDGTRTWFDEYDPISGSWKTLADAPFPRDHFQVAITEDQLYAFAGRTTSKATEEDISLTVSHGNVYDFEKEAWQPTRNYLKIPTERAGNAVFEWNGHIVIGGGESDSQVPAHSELEAFSTENSTWTKWPSMKQGRHGTGFACVGNYVYTASGSGNRGGEPELLTIERLRLPEKAPAKSMQQGVDSSLVHSLWSALTLSFTGPETSELDSLNPFLNYLLQVEFRNGENRQIIRGFYAADGQAGETSATSGAIWQARFAPDNEGEWSYDARLYKGTNVALSKDMTHAESVPLKQATGSFVVIPPKANDGSFSAKGRLTASEGFFKFEGSEKYFIKVGANSPENFLGYVGFDGTYRMKATAREGEASTSDIIHQYKKHLQDWKTGDPTWGRGKGKEIIGAVNYLASKGMNSIYFLTMNIDGDGRDVWPYESPDDFTRFDVSKLEQWEVLFEHMQSNGILLHVVLQETENETLFDGGDTGPIRQLYFYELIARFGHHLGLVWNLGEENGPASWSPVGQNNVQRQAMAKFLKQNDPYNHPVLLHTHSHDPLREDILKDILGFEYLDGLSLQQDEREQVAEVVQTWKEKSREAGNPWVITMDEIGMWHTGALTDSADSNHPTLMRHALWGSLLSGGAGVEWYFGARHPHNDLTSEDWRKRDQLWEISNNAKSFFESYVPWWSMTPQHGLVYEKGAFCLSRKSEEYVIYLPETNSSTLDLTGIGDTYSVHWYDPQRGGALQKGTVSSIAGGKRVTLGNSPNNLIQDWVVLVRKLD